MSEGRLDFFFFAIDVHLGFLAVFLGYLVYLTARLRIRVGVGYREKNATFIHNNDKKNLLLQPCNL